MERRKDVIVIGGGCAGIIAALEAEKQGASVMLIGRGSIGIGTNAALSNGIFAGPAPHTTPEEYLRLTLQTGKGLNRQSRVKRVTQKAPEAFSLLRSFGIQFEEYTGRYIVKSSRPDLLPGLTLMQTLAAKLKDSKGVEIVRDFYITEILKEGERVIGLKGFHNTGVEGIFEAPAIVLATGGGGAIYLRNDNQKRMFGQGYYLAAKAGLDLWDMEFIQFFPLAIAEPGLPPAAIFSPHPKEVRLINAAGEDILQKHGVGDLNEVIKTKRDEFSAILFREGRNGPVYMDYRNVPSSLWDKHPLSLLKKMHFDFQNKPLSVSPAAHFFMGGVETEEFGETSLPGLFACGEIVWGLHGANRMSGNALLEAVVFGRTAGQHAARYAFDHRPFAPALKGLSKDASYPPSSSRGSLSAIRARIKDAAWNKAGVVRSERGIKEGLAGLKELERELKGIIPQSVSDRKFMYDLMSAAFVLKAVFTASLSREESRGAFIREEFPQQDDLHWLKNSCLTYNAEEDHFTLRYSNKE